MTRLCAHFWTKTVFVRPISCALLCHGVWLQYSLIYPVAQGLSLKMKVLCHLWEQVIWAWIREAIKVSIAFPTYLGNIGRFGLPNHALASLIGKSRSIARYHCCSWDNGQSPLRLPSNFISTVIRSHKIDKVRSWRGLCWKLNWFSRHLILQDD